MQEPPMDADERRSFLLAFIGVYLRFRTSRIPCALGVLHPWRSFLPATTDNRWQLAEETLE